MFRLMLLFSLLATTVALPRPLDRGPVRNPRQPLDIANPQDENYVLRNGTLAFNFTNFGFFGNDGPSQSSSLDDPCSGTWAPQFEYPEGSDAQYLFQGGLWVGALIDYGDSLVPRVSVGTDGWQNPSVAEFHAGEAPNNGIVLRSNLPDATDCFGNSIYDPNAQANIEAVAVYSDTLTDQLFVMPVPLDGQHRPLGLEITQIARLWTAPEFARFVILDYEIENIGEHALVDPVIGFYMDCDVGVAGVNNEHIDDITGAFVIDSETDRTIAWTADNDGRSVGGGPIVLPHAFGMAPLSIELGSIAANYPGSYNWWNPNPDVNLDFGPAWQDTPTWTSSRGTPIRDSESYDILAGNEIDYGTYAIRATHPAQNDDYECHTGGEHEWRQVNLDDQTQRDIADGYDVRFLLGIEKFGRYDYTDTTGACHYRLEPHETSTVTFVMFIGEYFHDPAHPQPDPANLDSTLFHYEGLRWTYALSRVVYDSDYTFQPPSHPQNMQVVQAQSGQIPLEWDSPAHGEIAGYRVYGRPDSGQGERVELTTGTIVDEEFVVTGLTNGDDWLIEVVSVDAQSFESAPSKQIVRVGAIPRTVFPLAGSTPVVSTRSRGSRQMIQRSRITASCASIRRYKPNSTI
ncbi:MAG: fibronectin type III domain-containing protein [bacterium]|nr:fibronectin type III domain-containing protein [bacterium]